MSRTLIMVLSPPWPARPSTTSTRVRNSRPNDILVEPTSISSPSVRSTGPLILLPFRYVPFLLPLSSTAYPPAVGKMTAWQPELKGSARTMSLSAERPILIGFPSRAQGKEAPSLG